jgi:hypothetical protein
MALLPFTYGMSCGCRHVTRLLNSSTRFSIGVPVRKSTRCARPVHARPDLNARVRHRRHSTYPQFGDLPQRPGKRAVGERPQSIGSGRPTHGRPSRSPQVTSGACVALGEVGRWFSGL